MGLVEHTDGPHTSELAPNATFFERGDPQLKDLIRDAAPVMWRRTDAWHELMDARRQGRPYDPAILACNTVDLLHRQHFERFPLIPAIIELAERTGIHTESALVLCVLWDIHEAQTPS